MGWSIGYDDKWKRDIGYGVPAYCDEPGCDVLIDRGLSYVCCGNEPYGGEYGCGLFFCPEHQHTKMYEDVYEACSHEGEYVAKPDHPKWIIHKLKDASWEQWRIENPEEVQKLLTSPAQCQT